METNATHEEGARMEALPRLQWLEGDPLRRLLRDFAGERAGFVRVSEKGYVMPSGFAREADAVLRFQPRPEDTWVVTFPRSGTTVTQEMVWLLNNRLDFAAARATPLVHRSPFLEFSTLFGEATFRDLLAESEGDPHRRQKLLEVSAPAYEALDRMQGPRDIKTHLPPSLLHRDLLTCGAKVVYVARNPKDVAVSYYHHNRLIRLHEYKGDFPTYWDYFQNDLVLWAPYWSHLEEGWRLRSHPRVLFMFYEELVHDMKAAIRKVASFLEKQFTEREVESLAEYLDVTNFRQNPAVNFQIMQDAGILKTESEEGFVRKGETGGWTEYFTPELQTKAEKWIEENLAKTNIRFPTFDDTTHREDRDL